jgi:CHASE3 domain sensor protein
MTTQPSSPERKDITHALDGREPAKSGSFSFANLKIGTKLAIGFGVLVVLTFFSAGISFQGSTQAKKNIDRTSQARVPAALSASRAQAHLLRMQADVRGYLALGEKPYRQSYEDSRIAFEKELANLHDLSQGLDDNDRERLSKLDDSYKKWAELPDQLFALRDDQLDREPAYRMLVTTGTQHAGDVLINIQTMIEEQGKRSPTADNLSLLGDMAKFQGNFASMLSALRGYTTTRNRIYRAEFEVNLADNGNSWERLNERKDELSVGQLATLQKIADAREKFLALPDEMFIILSSKEWRLDLYDFSTKALPLANDMQTYLSEIVSNQQTLLTNELTTSQQDLARNTQLILFGGIIAFAFGLGSWYASSSTIAGPVRRLTDIAERIRSGNLNATASVESRDEIGVLASTFNNMTAKLRDTLFQVRKEKKRADDLLEVVIPIGVELSTEKDFNRLLEKMLLEAKSFCKADMGMLYLRPTQEKKELKYVIVNSDSLQIALGGTTGREIPFKALSLTDASGEPNHRHVITHVALSGATVNIPSAAQAKDFDDLIGQEELLKGYSVESLLAMPLKNSQDQVLGVIQLINPKDAADGATIAFDPNLQQMMESFSSLAVAALEAYIREQALRVEVAQLRIEIDQAKRQKQVGEIVESEFFRDLQSKVSGIRNRHKGGSESQT